MCGIAGGFAFTNKGLSFLEKIEEANQTLAKRGPDGGQVFRRGAAALAHRRLSIIDISCAGDQPMHSVDERYTIIFNGEIFNYRELQQQYLSPEEQRQLRSHSDTEIFLFLFSKFREQTFALLQGFFAAAIFDHAEEELFLARDRFGKKPLLIYRDEDKILFASEMKAMLRTGIPKKIVWSAVPVYLQLNYLPQPYSFIEGVEKLKPGYYLRVSKKEVNEKAYYQLKIHRDRYNELSYEKAQEQLEKLMDRAVQARMVSDVPLGAFLSGGIDSSVVVALASRHTQKLKTFSVGYKDNPFFDETHYADLVAKKYKTDHTVFSLSNNDFLEHVYGVLDYLDEPFADSSAIPEYILSHYTRRHVTVALSGDGGDEVFAGYNKHAAELRIRQKSMVNSLVFNAHPLWAALPKSRSSKIGNTIRQLHRFSSAAKLTPSQRYWQWASFSNEAAACALLHDDILNLVNKNFLRSVSEEFTKRIWGEDFNEVLLADMELVLVSDMLVKVDLMSMANSLEIRSPFLDQRVVDFGFGLPVDYKINRTIKKRIVQDTFRRYLPEELYNRKKQGFEIPLLDWFRKELWSLIDSELLERNFVSEQKIFNVAQIENLKKSLHSSNPGDAHATLWALIVFQYWWKHYIE